MIPPRDSMIHLRLSGATHPGLKSRAVRCARRRNLKLSPWLSEAIAEKVRAEESANSNTEPAPADHRE